MSGLVRPFLFFFFFNDTATTEIYTLSLHDALPICRTPPGPCGAWRPAAAGFRAGLRGRSEEHTSELQSRLHLVCRLLLEKKKTTAISGTLSTTQFTTRPAYLRPLPADIHTRP